MVRIICIGNRFYYPDDFGIKVYEKLKNSDLKDIEVVEGGIGGMNLALYFEDDAKILIVDYGISDKKFLTKSDIDKIELFEYNHSNSLLYLLKTIDKEYKIYICNEKYDKNNLQRYIDEILTIAKSML